MLYPCSTKHITQKMATPIGKFVNLDTPSKNYLEWVNKFKNYVEMNMFKVAIPAAFGKDDGDTPAGIKAMVDTAMCTHMDEGLCKLYGKEKDPIEVWKAIKDKYEEFVKTSQPKYCQLYCNPGIATCLSLRGGYQTKQTRQVLSNSCH